MLKYFVEHQLEQKEQKYLRKALISMYKIVKQEKNKLQG